MSIRQDIELDISKYKKSLNEADRAAIKYARKSEKNFRKQQRALESITTELNRLKAVREASNNPKAVRQYTQAIEKLEKEQTQLRKETDKYSSAVSNSSKKTESAFKRIGRSAKMWLAGAAAGALLYVGSLVRDMGGEMMRFNEEMNKSLAIQGNVTMEQRNRMEEAAKSVSRELNIATDKVAKGYYYLASAGLSVEEQIANLPKVAEFAKAGMFDLATATDLATDAQSALGLTVENTTQNQRNLVRVTDVLVSANQQANATVQQFSEALTNKGATALRNVNKDIEEGVAVLAAYADQGIKGREAGEYLSRTLRILSEAANENIEQFKELGIVTADGNLADFPTIIEALTGELGGLSDTAMTAKFKQMGFTSEVQEAIKPLLGLSDGVAEYEKNLREAAGATEEVADKQLKSLTQRLGSLKRQLVDTFGDDVVSGLETTVNLLEDMYEAVVGTQEEIRKEQAVEGALQSIGGLYGSDMTGWGFQNLRAELQSLYDAQKKNTDEFNRQNREMATNIESYSTWASEVEGASEKVADANEELKFREMVLKRNIERNKELIDSEKTSVEQKARLSVRNDLLIRKLESTQGALSSTRKYLNQTTEEEKQQEQTVSDLADRYLEFQSNIKSFSLGNLDKILPEDLTGMHMEQATQYVQKYNNALTEAHNELRSGAITQEQYEQRVKDATDTFYTEVKRIYNLIKDNLTPAQEEAFKKILGNFKDAGNEAKDAGDDVESTADKLRDMADTADAIVNVAEAVGGIGEKARQSLSGLSDMLRATSKLMNLGSGAGFLDYAVPGLGLAAGLITTLTGLFGSSGDSQDLEEMQRLRENIEDNVYALKQNTSALREDNVVASGANQKQVDSLNSLLDEALNIITAGRTVQRSEAENLVENIANTAEEAGIDLGVDIEKMFDDLMAEGKSPRAALMEILGIGLEKNEAGIFETVLEEAGLGALFRDLQNDLGEYGKSLGGAIQQFRDAIEYGSLSTNEAMDQFVDRLRSLDSNIPSDLLKELESLDLSTEEGKNRLDEIIKELYANSDEYMGDMTPDEWSNLLDFFKSQTEGGGTSATGSEASGYSRSVQIARTITDVQANEIVMFLEMIEKWTRDTAAAMGSETAISVNESGRGLPSMNIPIPLPVEVVNSGQYMEKTNSSSSSANFWETLQDLFKKSKNNSVSMGDVNIGRNEITDEDIDEIGRKFTRKLKQEIRGKQF